MGGCVSVHLFLLCAEIIAIELRKCEKIKGIPVQDIVNLLLQYMDDLNIASNFDQGSLNSTFETLEHFRFNSGFTISYDKTSIYRIGSIRNTDAKLITQKPVAWTSDYINVLGVKVSYNEETVWENYTEILTKVSDITQMWQNRRLSLMGKVIIINTLIASLFVYKMMVLLDILEDIHKRIDKLIQQFLWNNRSPKIALKLLKLDKKVGGLRLMDLWKRQKAIKLTWLQVMRADRDLSTIVYPFIAPVLGEHIWRCTLKAEDCGKIIEKERSPFWFGVLQTWCEMNYQQQVKSSKQLLWFNSKICCENSPFLWKKCFKAGLLYVNQIFDTEGNMISAEEAWEKYRLTPMELNTPSVSIPQKWKNGNPASATQCYYDRYIQIKSPSKYMYNQMIEVNDALEVKRQKWERDLQREFTNQEFLTAFQQIYVVTNISKYRSFQFRLLHRALVTNIHLQRWGIKTDSLCTFCENAMETVEHLLISCEYVSVLWWKVFELMGTYTNQKLVQSTETILFNRVAKSGNIANFICLVTKQFVYGKKCAKQIPHFNDIKALIISLRNCEKYIAVKNGKTEQFYKKWHEADILSVSKDTSMQEFMSNTF